MRIFWKSKPSDKPVEQRSIIELIESVPHVSPMNMTTVIKGVKNGDKRVWVNPNNQTCFNFGWFTRQDFIDWANGTGKIVKGKNQEEKDKFMKYARAYQVLDLCVFNYGVHLDILDTTTILHGKSSYGNKYYRNLEKTAATEVIRLVLSDIAREAKSELASAVSYARFLDPKVDITKIVKEKRDKYEERSLTACWTLSILGKGYFGACNTPCVLENLGWSRDLPFATAYYEFLKEDGYDLPDFKWVIEHRY
jgi:hypothetical protein